MQLQLLRGSRPPRFPDRGRSTGFQVRSGEGVRIPQWDWLASSGLGLLLVGLLWAGIPEFESAFGRDGSSVRRAGRVPLEVGGLWPGPPS